MEPIEWGAAIWALLESLTLLVAALSIVWVLAGLIPRAIASIPVVGGPIYNAMADAIGLAQRTAQKWAAQNTEPTVQALASPAQSIMGYVTTAVSWAGAVTQSIIALAQAAQGSVGGLAGRVNDLAQTVGSLGTAVTTVISTVQTIVHGITQIITVTVPTMINQAIHTLRGYVDTAISVEQIARAVAITELTGLVTQLNEAALTAIKVGDMALAHELDHVAAQLAAAIVTAEATAIADIDAVAAHLQIELGAITDVAIPAALATALAATATVAAELTQITEDCINPTCAARSAGLDLFALLQAGAELLAIVTLLGVALRDPRKAAGDLVAGVGELMALARPVLDVIGIRT